MKVFVTGGTRVLGQPVVRLLIERGHTVRALSRSDRSDQTVRALGAEPVRADLFVPAALRTAVGAADAVLHLATRIPPTSDLGNPAAWAENDRIRGEGTRHLVDAALAAGARAFVYPSVAFVYPDRGAEWTDATNAEPIPVGVPFSTTLDAEVEVARFAATGGRGISLRMGLFYGPTSSYAQETLAYARQGVAGVVGRDDAYHGVTWVDDAATAVVAAMEGAPAGVYDVVDDEPPTTRGLVAALAAAAGQDQLQQVPDDAMRAALGPVLFEVMSRSQRVSNRRFKEATGWSPAVPNARAGWRLIASSDAIAQGHPAVAR